MAQGSVSLGNRHAIDRCRHDLDRRLIGDLQVIDHLFHARNPTGDVQHERSAVRQTRRGRKSTRRGQSTWTSTSKFRSVPRSFCERSRPMTVSASSSSEDAAGRVSETVRRLGDGPSAQPLRRLSGAGDLCSAGFAWVTWRRGVRLNLRWSGGRRFFRGGTHAEHSP